MKSLEIEFNVISSIVRVYTIRKKPKNSKIWSRQNRDAAGRHGSGRVG